jgi:nitrogen regulatory protein P-II 1
VRIEMVIADDLADKAVDTVAAAARTGKIGDGKIFVYDVADAIRIRNGDRGEAAI